MLHTSKRNIKYIDKQIYTICYVVNVKLKVTTSHTISEYSSHIVCVDNFVNTRAKDKKLFCELGLLNNRHKKYK